MRKLRSTMLIILAVVAGILLGLLLPWNIQTLSSHPQPVQSYAEAVQRIEVLSAYRASEMNPVCRVQFLTHGQKVERVIVLVHGYTSCPQQFRQLGQQFYDLGYNVLIAPLPHHGLADRMTAEQSQLTAGELAAYADEMVDIADGLGERVVMAGLSGGGVTTAWAAQNRSDLDRAVLISPAFGFRQVPTWLTAPAMNLYLTLPDSYEWWNPALQAATGPFHAYPRYSRHALAETLRLGFAVQVKARQAAPSAHTILVITNANDTAVNNDLTAQVVANWRQHGADLVTDEFEASLGLPHDLIDPAQTDQQVEIVYPQLIDWITR